MKFNVEMTKDEMRRVMGKPAPIQVFAKKLGKGMKQLNKACKKKPIKATVSIIVAFVVVFCAFGLLRMSYNAGYDDAHFHHRFEQGQQQDKATADYFEDRSLKETASWFAKSVLVAIGNNLHIFFFIVGLAWLIHGVGFRIFG